MRAERPLILSLLPRGEGIGFHTFWCRWQPAWAITHKVRLFYKSVKVKWGVSRTRLLYIEVTAMEIEVSGLGAIRQAYVAAG